MQIGTICERNVVTLDKTASIPEAARAMRSHHVGDIVILDEDGGPAGIVTDRDIVVELVATDADLGSVAVGDIMSSTIASVKEDADLFETLRFMGVKGVRRLPVLDPSGRLVGILSVQDAIRALIKELNFTTDIAARQLERERHTRA